MSKGKFPVYFFLAIVFLGIAKILQIFVFDADQYKKSKETKFSNSNKTETPKKKDVLKAGASIDSLRIETQPTTDTLEVATNVNDDLQEASGQEQGDWEENESQGSDFANTNDLSDLKNTYLAPIISKLPQGQLREDVVIRYYRHDQDGEKVYALKDLGYYIHEKEATETAGLGSNVIYYGSDVAVEDIKIVAFTLQSQGIPIKSIKPTSFGWKSNAIEIGTDPDLIDSVNLTVLDIQNFSK
ncbi:hypothetical protein [Ekhidna sp.]|uniref:hypothetical protein n=1 Tax=Ekhidna sp. TaxID=2608089 RepID=UPI003CCBD1B4